MADEKRGCPRCKGKLLIVPTPKHGKIVKCEHCTEDEKCDFLIFMTDVRLDGYTFTKDDITKLLNNEVLEVTECKITLDLKSKETTRNGLPIFINISEPPKLRTMLNKKCPLCDNELFRVEEKRRGEIYAQCEKYEYKDKKIVGCDFSFSYNNKLLKKYTYSDTDIGNLLRGKRLLIQDKDIFLDHKKPHIYNNRRYFVKTEPHIEDF